MHSSMVKISSTQYFRTLLKNTYYWHLLTKFIRLNIHTLFLTTIATLNAKPLPVQLASVYNDELIISDFFISEKYDGIRAIWKDGKLTSRNGTLINAPVWFTESLPNIWLDGELWSKHQDFEFISSTVRKKIPVESEWRKISYMVFDIPDYIHTFQERSNHYSELLTKLNLPHVKPIKQMHVYDNADLSTLLTEYVNNGSEGLILHKSDALFSHGRSSNLFKLKPYLDSEAIVIEHLSGKGKYTDVLGAIWVRWKTEEGKEVEFKIGSGFSDKERANPPPLGSKVTFKYHGLTKKSIPRFASFLRIRKE